MINSDLPPIARVCFVSVSRNGVSKIKIVSRCVYFNTICMPGDTVHRTIYVFLLDYLNNFLIMMYMLFFGFELAIKV